MDPSQSIEERLNSALADRYRVEGEIGRGGMATVYLAIGGGVEVPGQDDRSGALRQDFHRSLGLGQLAASWGQVQGNQALEKPLPCSPRGEHALHPPLNPQRC